MKGPSDLDWAIGQWLLIVTLAMVGVGVVTMMGMIEDRLSQMVTIMCDERPDCPPEDGDGS